MKLSSLSPEQKTKLLAELDGYYNLAMQTYTSNRTRPFEQELGWFGNRKPFDERQTFLAPYYPTSYDAIIPLRQKLNLISIVTENTTPEMLCGDTLIATGKCEL